MIPVSSGPLLRRAAAHVTAVALALAAYASTWSALFLLSPGWRSFQVMQLSGFADSAGVETLMLRYGLQVSLLAISLAASAFPPKGRSIFLRLFRLRVVGVSGLRPTRLQMIIRWLSLVLSTALLGLPTLWSLVDKQGRAPHDLISGTSVIST